jgi:hypothetical protein
MQLYKIIYHSLAALHVSRDIFAQHQEHLNCIIASGITHVCRCRLLSWECWNWRSHFQHSHDNINELFTFVKKYLNLQHSALNVTGTVRVIAEIKVNNLYGHGTLSVQRHNKRCRSDIVVHFPYTKVFLHCFYRAVGDIEWRKMNFTTILWNNCEWQTSVE